jgi:hypothetical protein
MDLITRVYRKLKNLSAPKMNDPKKKWANELNRTFSKEEVQMAKKHTEKEMSQCNTLDRYLKQKYH